MSSKVTARELSHAVMQRITSGLYAPGERLPSVRVLASELGSNRNTINKAYQMLQEMGVIDPSPSGRRGFVVRNVGQRDSQSKQDLLGYFYRQSVELVWRGMAAGLSSDEMNERLTTAVQEVYGKGEVHLLFLECNESDSIDMSRNLTKILGLRVRWMLLDRFNRNATGLFQQNDLIITTFHHMAEVLEAVQKACGSADKVAGIDTRPTPETMLGVARLPGTRIGLICTLQSTTHMLKHIFFSYHPDWVIETATLEEPVQVRLLAAACDHLIVTHTCAEEVIALAARKPDVVVNFQIDEQSIIFLKQRINEIQKEKTLSLARPTVVYE